MYPGERLRFRENLDRDYPDVYTPEAVGALESLSRFDPERITIMEKRVRRRADRFRKRERIRFLDPDLVIPRTGIMVRDARAGAFKGAVIPRDLRRQWIQGTGPGTKPNASTSSSAPTPSTDMATAAATT